MIRLDIARKYKLDLLNLRDSQVDCVVCCRELCDVSLGLIFVADYVILSLFDYKQCDLIKC